MRVRKVTSQWAASRFGFEYVIDTREYVQYFELRKWCREQWGESMELFYYQKNLIQFGDWKNQHWSFDSKTDPASQNKWMAPRIYLSSDKELTLYTLAWG